MSVALNIESRPVLVTGMSGAGLNSAARVLEDLGWYVAQNLPAELAVELVELCVQEGSPARKVAMVTDVRTRDFHGDLTATIAKLTAQGFTPTVLFMDANDEVLIRRFDSVRRTHPLQGAGTLQTGIERERAMLAEVKENADIVIDTSEKSIHDLRHAVESSFSTLENNRQHITVQSFGFKHGAPRDADFVFDMRFLPNPFWIPELRPFRGRDKPVSDYVLSQPGAEDFLVEVTNLVATVLKGYRHEGKSFIAIAIGCTGGHHRSVAIAEEIGRRIAEFPRIDVSVVHRDIHRS